MNTDIEDLLREGMERFTADLRAPAGMIYRAARRRRRRRLALRSAAGAATALAACAVALVAAGAPGVRLNGTTPAAYVVKRVDSALSAAEPGDIAQMTVTTSRVTPDGATVTITTEEWSYGGQWRLVASSPAGQPVYDEGFSTASVYTLVSYPARTWARQPGPGRPAALVPSPPGCGPAVAALPLLFQPGLPGIGFSASSRPATAARALRAAISCGTLAVAGRQRIDGIEAIELTSRQNSPISETIWVSPGTYLPVRVVVRSALGVAVRQQTADITWLPPSAQNRARLTVPIPAGFRHVPLATAVGPLASSPIPGRSLPTSPAPCLAPAGPACNGGTSVSGSDPEHVGHPRLKVWR
jgi:hypothetical protein